MATFVLVHGAWHGGWCWKRVRPLLAARGHEVFTPTLSGVGERSHLLRREVGLETHITDVVNVMRWEELSDVVLCGHSYGGMVISGVADRLPDRIRSLVYVDAFVPTDGQATFDFMPAERVQTLRDNTRAEGDGWRVPPIPAAVFKVRAEDQAWVDRQCTPHPIACFEEKIRLTGGLDRIARRTFLLAADYQPSAFQGIAERLRRDPAWRVVAMPCGHDIMVDLPRELADALLAAA
jgi:pimeloyl-ACP methyl ester carboxylesterase